MVYGKCYLEEEKIIGMGLWMMESKKGLIWDGIGVISRRFDLRGDEEELVEFRGGLVLGSDGDF